MAFHSRVAGIQAWIEVAGARTTHYDDHDAKEANKRDLTTTTKYIESVSGASFTVNFQVENTYNWGFPSHDLELRCYVNGQWEAIYFVSKIHTVLGPHTGRFTGKPGISSQGQMANEDFKFASIETVDDIRKERVQNDMKIAKGLGAIELRFHRCFLTGWQPYQDPQPQSNTPTAIAEKALKGRSISHTVAHEQSRVVSQMRVTHFQNRRYWQQDEHRPLAIFRFLYRSREDLEKELTIPRAATPPDALINLSREEINRLAMERLDQLKVEQESQQKNQTKQKEPKPDKETEEDKEAKEKTKLAIKRERDDSPDGGHCEDDSRATKLPRHDAFDDEEFIDLTEE
ncbi:hypothetical protein JX265_005771 [Neoarthrinium moseri]|uniref:DUF7918 domain-containing protein n=1 Tax=Neoarthrinium moseri TaxID=1658444 RepID=A0A9Q0AQ84_9PEZI|nr:hypothetical protein JX265_005771 [Neoarthrinium moseri]